MIRRNDQNQRLQEAKQIYGKGFAMDLNEYGYDYAVVRLSKEELLFIAHALTDVLALIESYEFRTRISGTQDEVSKVRDGIENILGQMQ